MPHIERVNILGSFYSCLSKEKIQEEVLKRAQTKIPGYVCVANVHTTMMGFWNPQYQQITNESCLAVPDGMPLVWAMKSFGVHDQNRVRGPTLMRDLFDLGREKKIRHYLFGGTEETIRLLVEILNREYPGAVIVGAESPPFRPLEDINEAEWEASAKRINDSGAQILWVGLGAPKQEQWMFLQRKRIQPVMLGVGAAFDLLSGKIPEAPALLQKMGMEWAYRLGKEPRRLWRRYIFNNPAFLILWFFQLLRRRF